MFTSSTSDRSDGPADIPASGPRSTRGPVQPARPAAGVDDASGLASGVTSELESDAASVDGSDPASAVGSDPASAVGSVVESDAESEVASVVAEAPEDGGVDIARRLEEVRGSLSALTAAVPDRADASSVEDWLANFRRLESVVAGLRVRLVGCVQLSRTHEEGGHAATTSYLRDHLGVSGREAKRQDVIARDLRQLPGTRAALSAGEIGPEQAQAIGEAARRGDLGDHRATEELLLDAAADQGADEFRRHIKRQEQEADRRSLERDEQRAYRRRAASLARRSDGMWDLHALLTDEDGETLATALDAFRTPDAPGTPIPEQRSPQQRTADALVDVVGAALCGKVPRSGGVRPHLNLLIPVELLEQDSTEVASAGHGGVLSAAAAARLLCDANVRRILARGDSEVLDVGRSKREWSVGQRQALHVRDGGCRAPGCDRPVAWTDAHHIKWWTKGGVTSVDNGLLLCRRHHRMVHEGGWSVSLDLATAVATFTSPTGRVIETRPHRWRGGGAVGSHTEGSDNEATEVGSSEVVGEGVEGARSVDQPRPPADTPATGQQASLDLGFNRPAPVVVAREELGRGDDVTVTNPGVDSRDRSGWVSGGSSPPVPPALERSDRRVARERRGAYRARSGTDPPRPRHGPAPPRTGDCDHRVAHTATGAETRSAAASERSHDRRRVLLTCVWSDARRGALPWPVGHRGLAVEPAVLARSRVPLYGWAQHTDPFGRSGCSPRLVRRARRGTLRRQP